MDTEPWGRAGRGSEHDANPTSVRPLLHMALWLAHGPFQPAPANATPRLQQKMKYPIAHAHSSHVWLRICPRILKRSRCVGGVPVLTSGR